jgi:hypothetical protein
MMVPSRTIPKCAYEKVKMKIHAEVYRMEGTAKMMVRSSLRSEGDIPARRTCGESERQSEVIKTHLWGE